MTSPFLTHFGLLQRSLRYVEMYRPDALPTVGYQFWAHRHLDDAYGDPVGVAASGVGGAGTTALFEVTRGSHFRSDTLRRKKLGLFESNRRGQTTVAFDIEDFIAPGAGTPLGPDSEWMFLRVQENRNNVGLLAHPGVPEATVTLAAVGAGDRLTVKTIVFEFAVGANDLVGKAGTGGDPFIVGLGADDNAAAANLTAALNDNGDVAPAMDAVDVVGLHTFATNVGAPSAVVLIQPENGDGTLVPGSLGEFDISTPDDPRVSIDAAALAAGTLVSAADPTNPVLGPIYCVPPALFFGQSAPTLTLSGTAPSGTNCAAGQVPAYNEDVTDASPRPLHIVFPRPLAAFGLTNMEAAGGNDILVSFGADQLMQVVGPGQAVALNSGRTRNFVLACPDAGGADFRLHGVAGMER